MALNPVYTNPFEFAQLSGWLTFAITKSNLESIEDFHPGMETHLDWEEATGQWVHVEIITMFGKSMKVV